MVEWALLQSFAAIMCPSSCNAAAIRAAIEIYECVKKRAISIIIHEKLNFILIDGLLIKNPLRKDIKFYVGGKNNIKFSL